MNKTMNIILNKIEQALKNFINMEQDKNNTNFYIKHNQLLINEIWEIKEDFIKNGTYYYINQLKEQTNQLINKYSNEFIQQTKEQLKNVYNKSDYDIEPLPNTINLIINWILKEIDNPNINNQEFIKIELSLALSKLTRLKGLIQDIDKINCRKWDYKLAMESKNSKYKDITTPPNKVF